MDSNFQSTFIPHKGGVAGDPYTRPKRVNFFMLIGSVLFILSVAAFGGLYFYKSYVTKNNEQKKAQIEQTIQNFEPELTKELTVLKARMDVGKQLLENHNAFSLMLALLEVNTAQPVRFSQLSFSSDGKKVALSLRGEARSYGAIAFQSDIFSRVEQLKSPVFTGLKLNEQGTISFDVSAEVAPGSMSYKKMVESFSLPPTSTPLPPATTTPPASTTTISS